VRVHQELLARQKLPRELVTKNVWEERYEDINAVERYLSRNGYLILKFFLHVSRREQKKRFLERLDQPDKNWKFSTVDVSERQYWDDYMDAYEGMIRNTATKHAPWFVVPADNKWFTRLVVAAAIVEALEELDLRIPKVDEERRRELAKARRLLIASLDLPVGAVATGWDAFVLRDGDPVMLVGFKQTMLDPAQTTLRAPPARTSLSSLPEKPLLIFPIAAERRTLAPPMSRPG